MLLDKQYLQNQIVVFLNSCSSISLTLTDKLFNKFLYSNSSWNNLKPTCKLLEGRKPSVIVLFQTIWPAFLKLRKFYSFFQLQVETFREDRLKK